MSLLEEFMRRESELPVKGCSASSDCDRERAAAYQEILRLRRLVKPRRRWWRWGYRA